MLIANGIYKVKVTEAIWQPNRNRNGHYLKIGLTIIDNSAASGLKLFHYFNFDNPKPNAVKMAQESWINFCHAGNLGALSFDFNRGPDNGIIANLLGHPTTIEVITKPDKDNIPRNNIKVFLPYNYIKKEAETLFKKEEPALGYQDPNDYPVSEKDYSDLNDDVPF